MIDPGAKNPFKKEISERCQSDDRPTLKEMDEYLKPRNMMIPVQNSFSSFGFQTVLHEPFIEHSLLIIRAKPSGQVISRKYKIHGYPFKTRLVWGNAICFAVLHRNEHLLKLIMSSYLKDFNYETKHSYVNQALYLHHLRHWVPPNSD